jgi:hypothetical protein
MLINQLTAPRTLSIYLWLYSPLLDFGRFFSFLIFYTVGSTPWTGDQPVARPLPAHRTAQTQNKRTQKYMPQVGFEPTIPVFERAKTVHALDRDYCHPCEVHLAQEMHVTVQCYLYELFLTQRNLTSCAKFIQVAKCTDTGKKKTNMKDGPYPRATWAAVVPCSVKMSRITYMNILDLGK